MASGTSGSTTSSRVSTTSFGRSQPSRISLSFTLVPGFPSRRSVAATASSLVTSAPSIATSRSPTRTPLSNA
eukprot:3784796-Rhodomonas_salina.1